AYGVNYDLVSLDAQGSLQIELLDPITSIPKYNSIIQTHARLAYSSNGNWNSNGIGAQKAILDDYCAKYDVRRVMLNSGPTHLDDDAINGLDGRLSTAATTVAFGVEASLEGINNAVQPGVAMKVGHENEFTNNRYWIVPGYLDDALNTDKHILPLLSMYFEVASTDIGKVTEPVGAISTALGGVIHRNVVSGVEIMYFFFTANTNGLLGPALAHSWLPWVTKGLFMGQRRLLLDTQIDDFYLDTRTYNSGPRYRNTATDYEFHAAEQDRINAASMLNAYSHPNNWSPNSIVTPGISGLNYTESVSAMLEAGHRFAVGDNSRADLKPENPWHPFVAQVKAGAGGKLLTDLEKTSFEDNMERLYGQRSIYVIPRMATQIYFDAATQQQLRDEFNSFYGPTCYGYDQSASATDGGYKCSVDSWKYPRDLTAAEIIDMEGIRTARNLLLLRIDPYMFHQANLAVSEGVSFLSLWLRAVTKWINSYVSFPIVTYKMDDLGLYFLRRKYRDECGLQATVTYTGGLPVRMAVSAQGKCSAVVTHSRTPGSELTVPRMRGVQYGEYDTNYYLPMAADRTTIVQLGLGECDNTCLAT
ncbi:hypothetical protein SARC_08668, partial [Sphaeroforma arctica JP610]